MLLTAVLFAGVFSGWVAIVQFYLRHVGLTVLTFVAPLPLVIVGYWLGARFEGGLTAACAICTYEFAVVCFLLLFGRTARDVCDGLSPRDATSKALINLVRPLGMTGAAVALSILVLAGNTFLAGLAVVGSMLVAFAWVIAAAWSAQRFAYSEKFIADANGARERRERQIEKFSRIVETRWAFSVSGMAIILATIAAFSALTLRVQETGLSIRVVGIALLAFTLFTLGDRNWRLAMAQFLTLAFEVGMGLWAVAQGAPPISGDDLTFMGLTIMISAMPLAVLASVASGYLREGERVDTALSRALQLDGPGAALACALSMVLWLAVTLIAGTAQFQTGVALGSLPATLLIFPALTTAIYTVLPRYRSFDEVFGKR